MNRCSSTIRGGFTLVELLVAMAIFSILAALTVSAFRGNDSDRISAATSTFRNALEGARSRAIKSGQVRGLRLLTDPNDNKIATSLVYVGPPEYDEGNCNIVFNAPTGRWWVNSSTGSWSNLRSRGLLPDPLVSVTANTAIESLNRTGEQSVRIEIPRDSGNWYRVVDAFPDDPATLDHLVIAGHFTPSFWDATANGYKPSQPLPISYRLELAPTILPNADPMTLPANTCIDLDGSQVPADWLVKTAGNFSGYSSTMDILFAPSGDMAPNLKSAGILHFRIAKSSELIVSRGNGIQRNAAGVPAVVADPDQAARAVSIFAQTGGIVISEIDPTPSVSIAGANNEIASQPYRFAIRGKEAK